MTNRTLIFIWTSALGIAGLIVTILGAGGFITFLHVGDRGIWWLSIGAILALLVFLSVSFFFVARSSSRRLRDWQSRKSVLRVSKCKNAEIRVIAEIASDEFGGHSTSVDQTLRLHALDEKIFTAIIDSTEVIVGYFCLVRLTKAGADAVLRNDFHIATAPVEYVNTSNKRTYQQVYVGAVYGQRHHSKMFALGSMINELTEMKPKLVCARAATHDGLRVLKKYGFQPVSGRPETVGELFWLKGPIPRR